MDFKVEHELIPLSEVIYDGIQEQGIEFEYILPDYYPDIFRMIKCEALPEVISYTVSDGKLSYELCVSVNILYCSENSKQVNTIKQKMNYTKTVESAKIQDQSEIVLIPKTDYVNCRVVNQKRVDIKGAVTTKIKVIGENKQEMICDVRGLNVQLQKRPVEYAVGKLSAYKTTEISEEIELSHSKPQVKSIIRSVASAGTPEIKVISNKLIVKGNIDVNILYSCEDSGIPSMETMKFTVPYSQILDISGVDEAYKCYVNIHVVSCDVTPSADSDGNMYRLKCEVNARISCNAMKSGYAELVTDIYSTRYPCDFNLSKVKISCMPSSFDESASEKYILECSDSKIDKVYDVWCSAGNTSIKTIPEEKCIMVSAMLHYAVMYREPDGMPVLMEKENAYEHKITVPEIDCGSYADAELSVSGCTYNLVSGEKITINPEIRISGKVYSSSEVKIVSDIQINHEEMKKSDGDYALRHYFGMSGESIWDIAKKYSTSVNAVMEENNLYDEKLSENSMLLIPIVK